MAHVNIEHPYLKPNVENMEQGCAGMAIEEKRKVCKERGAGRQESASVVVGAAAQDLLDLLAFSVNTVSSRENVPSKDVSAFMNTLDLDTADPHQADSTNPSIRTHSSTWITFSSFGVSGPTSHLSSGINAC